MTVQHILTSIEKLIKVHVDLYAVAVEKTEAIKTSDIQKMNALLVKEQMYVKMLEQLEQERGKKVVAFLQTKGVTGPGTLTECIEYAPLEDQNKFIEIGEQLASELLVLKNQNELNQQLLQQSIQFVNLNLSMFQADPDSYTYDKPKQATEGSVTSKSVFDSKA